MATTTRTARSTTKKTPDDSESLRDTQEVAQNAMETLGNTATLRATVYQKSQFDVGPNPDVTRHMVNPPSDLVAAHNAALGIKPTGDGTTSGTTPADPGTTPGGGA